MGGKVYGPEKSHSKAAGLFINSSLNYITAPSDKPGQGGFPFAFWQLLHYITVQSIDRDARFGLYNDNRADCCNSYCYGQNGNSDIVKLVTNSNVQRLIVHAVIKPI